MKNKPLLNLSLLFVLIVIALLFIDHEDDSATKPVSDDTSGERPASYVINGDIKSFGEDGQLAFSLQSKAAYYFLSDERIEINSPQLSINPNQSGHVTVNASQGLYLPKQAMLDLTGQVTLVREDKQADLKISTESLRIDQHADFISTDQAVTIEQADNQLRAIGLQAWLKQKRIELLSNVRGHYVFAP